jgi:SOS-response transcriptional repressor LexA
MSWQAIAWATKQPTGSPARKVLLLVLANYADEHGYCWPSQKTVAAGTEQSLDTIQRQLKRLADDGFVTVSKRRRFGGHWEGHAYQLNMRTTEPQNAARSQSTEVPAEVPTGGHQMPMGSHRTGRCGPAGPQALRHE